MRTTCSATLTTLLPLTSATVRWRWTAAWRSTWSEPTPGGEGVEEVGGAIDALAGEVEGVEGLTDDHVSGGEEGVDLGEGGGDVEGDGGGEAGLGEPVREAETVLDAAEDGRVGDAHLTTGVEEADEFSLW